MRAVIRHQLAMLGALQHKAVGIVTGSHGQLLRFQSGNCVGRCIVHSLLRNRSGGFRRRNSRAGMLSCHGSSQRANWYEEFCFHGLVV